MEWIPVWEELPPENEKVLVQYYNGCGDKDWIVARYSQGNWYVHRASMLYGGDDILEDPEVWCEIDSYSPPLSNKEAWGYVESEDEMCALIADIISYALRTPQPTAKKWLEQESSYTTKAILNW